MRDRGFALLLVLWSLVLLTLVTTRLVASSRDEARLAANLRSAANAEMLADAAVHEAMFQLLDRSGAGWTADGTVRQLTLPGGTVLLRITSQTGLVNPNHVPEALLQALLRAAGADAEKSRSTAASIMDWRSRATLARQFGAKAPEYRAAGLAYGPPQAPFQSVEEVGLVLGMTPDLFARLAPHMTVFYDGDPDPGRADPLVLQALRDASGQARLAATASAGDQVVSIAAEGQGADGGRFLRRAVVRLASSIGAGPPYQVLDWRRGGELNEPNAARGPD